MIENNSQPLISVVIPTHNRSQMLVRAIKSVLKQTYSNFEIIIVDDGSKDDTAAIVDSFMKIHSNIYYLRNDLPKGACNARNKGIIFANGKFIAGLDDDDEFTPNRLEVLLRNYDEKYAFICSDILIINKNNQQILSAKEIITFNDLLWANTVGSQVLVDKNRLLSLDLFDKSLPSAQDYDMWLRLVQKYGPAQRINIPLYILHTEHDAPRITTSSKRNKGYFLVYKKNKKFMNKKQKIYNLISLKKLSKKSISISWVVYLFPSFYFFHEIYMVTIIKIPLIERLKRGIYKSIKLGKKIIK